MTLRRFLIGLAALFLALVLTHAASYGTIGYALGRASTHAIGPAGVTMFVLGLFITSFVLLVPRGIRRWMWSSTRAALRPDRTGKWLLPASHKLKRRNQNRVPRVEDARPVTFILLALPLPTHAGTPIALPSLPPIEPIGVPAAPTESRKTTDLAIALKSLGYRRGEYATVIATLDESLPLETLIRQALAKLRRVA